MLNVTGPSYGNNSDTLQLMNGLRKCGMCIHTHTQKYYSAIRKNEILLFTGEWMELENIILSGVCHVQKDNDCMFSLMYGR
jgi:hypothetical protein